MVRSGRPDHRHTAVSLIAVGGAAYLVSKAIQEFVVQNIPVTVAVDSEGHSIHDTGPAEWRRRVALLAQDPPGDILDTRPPGVPSLSRRYNSA